MNKKLIAIAIASVMAAPVAMADMKISGRFAGHLVSTDKNGSGTAADEGSSDLSFGESGASRLVFDGTSGKAFARIGYVAGNVTTGINKSRDFYLGYKLGAGKISFGRMGGASKNIEKDPLITTFLQVRKTNAEAVTGNKHGSSSFIDDVVQFAGKAGGMKFKVQFDPQSNTARGTTGNYGISLVGKAGPVGYFLGHNNGDGTKDTDSETVKQSNSKIGVNMKFGSAKITLMTQNSDKEGTKKNATTILAQIGMGKGLAIHVAAASGKNDGQKNTFSRVAVTKKVNKGFMIYAGITSSNADGDDAVTKTGLGAIIKF